MSHVVFTSYEVVSKGTSIMGNNEPCKIAGIGSVMNRMFDATIRTLMDVMHVPNLKKNLI